MKVLYIRHFKWMSFIESSKLLWLGADVSWRVHSRVWQVNYTNINVRVRELIKGFVKQ